MIENKHLSHKTFIFKAIMKKMMEKGGVKKGKTQEKKP